MNIHQKNEERKEIHTQVLDSFRFSVHLELKPCLSLVGPEVEETAYFVETFDKFFHALNLSNFSVGHRKRKTFQLPYTSKKAKIYIQLLYMYIQHEQNNKDGCTPCISKIYKLPFSKTFLGRINNPLYGTQFPAMYHAWPYCH